MLDQIAAAFGSLKTAGDIIGSMVKLKNQSDVQAKAIELQAVIIGLQDHLRSLQTAQAAQASERAELESRLRRLEDWQAEKVHYRLHRFATGGIVYRFHPPEGDDRPAHDLCARCYDDGVKSILQATPAVNWYKALKCQRCGADVLIERISSTGITISNSPRTRWRDGFY